MYGINFGAPQIPDSIVRKFGAKSRIRLIKPAEGNGPRERAYLAGVAENERERNDMLVIADNGHRRLTVVQVGTLYGIYVS
jgi:hypothetical protein